MRFYKIAVLALLTFGLTGCLGSKEAIQGDKADYTYKRFKFGWRGESGFIHFRYVAKELNGMVAICGSYAESPGNRVSELTPEVVGRGFLEIDGDRVLHDIKFFYNHGQTTNLAGKSTNCVVTSSVWKANYSAAKAQLGFPVHGYKTT